MDDGKEHPNKFFSRKLALASGVFAVTSYMLSLNKITSNDWVNTTNTCVTSYMAGNVFRDLPNSIGEMVATIKKADSQKS